VTQQGDEFLGDGAEFFSLSFQARQDTRGFSRRMIIGQCHPT